MNTPTPPPGVVREFVSPVARRAHGIKVKDASGSLVFMGLGFLFIMAKNRVIGFDLMTAFVVTLLTLAVKGLLGYRYRRFRAPILRQFRHGIRRTVARAVVYAGLQSVSFALVMAGITLYGHAIPGGFLRAVGISFASSLLFGELVGWVIDKIAPYLEPYVRIINRYLEPVRRFVDSVMSRLEPYFRPVTRRYEAIRQQAQTVAEKAGQWAAQKTSSFLELTGRVYASIRERARLLVRKVFA